MRYFVSLGAVTLVLTMAGCLASVAPDHGVLPVPDASAFEPDAVTSENITAVHWPAPPAKTQGPAPRKHKFASRSEKRKERLTHAGKDKRRLDHAHRRKLTHYLSMLYSCSTIAV